MHHEIPWAIVQRMVADLPRVIRNENGENSTTTRLTNDNAKDLLNLFNRNGLR